MQDQRYEEFDPEVDAIRPTMPELSRRFFHYLFDISRVRPQPGVTWEDLILGCMLRVMQAERETADIKNQLLAREKTIGALRLELQDAKHTLSARNRVHREYKKQNPPNRRRRT